MHEFEKIIIIFLGAIFVKSKHVQQFCEDLHIFCTNLLRFFRIFTKSKLLGCAWTPCLLHQWTKMKKLTEHIIQKQAPEKCTFHGWCFENKGHKIIKCWELAVVCTPNQNSWLRAWIEDSFSAKKKAGAVFVELTAAYETVWHRSFTFHLQAAAIAAWYTHGPHDHGDCSQAPLYPYNQKWPKEQVTTPQERRPTGICPGAPSLQHLHLRLVNHHLQKVCICWRSSNHSCW